MTSSTLKLFIVAGEASADLHGARLLAELKESYGKVEAFGVGGAKMAAEGLEVVVPAESLSIVGVSAVLRKLPELMGYLDQLVERCRTERPDVAVLMDLPDFNLRLAKKLKKLGIKIVYYISPQVWAWRKSRLKTIQQYVDKMLVLFPFEKDFYDRNGVPSTFVGHPLLDVVRAREGHRGTSEVARGPRLALLPGSRRGELAHHAPLLLDVVKRLEAEFTDLEVRVPVAPTLSIEAVKTALDHPRISIEAGNAYEILSWADAAVVASGTATLETALITTPFCLVYSVSAFNMLMFHLFVRWKGPIGMPNLLLNKRAIQEFFQNTAKPELIEKECARLFRDDNYRRQMIRDLQVCRENLGSSGASRRAADEIRHLVSP